MENISLDLNESFKEYVEMTYKKHPQDLHPTQFQEIKRSYYAAVSQIVLSLIGIGQDDNITEESAEKILEGWQDQCEKFWKAESINYQAKYN